MITLDYVFALLGLFYAGAAILSAIDTANPRRLGNALFWSLLAVSFAFGSVLSDFANGVLVLGLAALGGMGALGQGRPQTTTIAMRRESARRRGNALFGPALLIPATALAGSFAFKHVPFVDGRLATVIALAFGIVIALAVAMIWLRPPLLAPLQEGRRLLDAVGSVAILPQLLAALGGLFTKTGVGNAVGALATHILPLSFPLEAIAAYCAGMALFTIVMGNAFAAFPVMTAAIGLPIIVHKFGGNPAIMGAIGMLAGFCGTLVTPMAANFNIVPAALLELPDRYGVIKAQIPTAIWLLLGNILLLYVLVFRF